MHNQPKVSPIHDVQLFCSLCILMGMVMGCETVPYVGQSQLVVIPQSQSSQMGGQITMAALGLGAKFGVLPPYSRTHESEADSIEILLAAKTGYSPHEAVRVWQRMQEGSEGAPSEFLSTHHETRVQRLQEEMPEALKIYRNVEHAPEHQLPSVIP